VTGAAPADALTVNVATLLAEPAGSVRDVAFAGRAIDMGDDLTIARPIDARVRLTRTNRGIFVDGDVRTALAEACSRCLRPIEVELTGEIAEEVLPSIDLHTGAPIGPSGEPEAARLTDHHEVELEPLVREAIVLGAPIAPVCRPDCPGLCPTCGLELGSGPHDHEEEPIDPRLEVLRAFRVDGPSENR
jgi:uncharacterized protein